MPLGQLTVKIPSEWKSVRRMTVGEYSAPLSKKFKKNPEAEIPFSSGGMRWLYRGSEVVRSGNSQEKWTGQKTTWKLSQEDREVSLKGTTALMPWDWLMLNRSGIEANKRCLETMFKNIDLNSIFLFNEGRYRIMNNEIVEYHELSDSED